MYNRKRIGARIDPCGTPLSIPKKDNEVLFIDTNYNDLISGSFCCCCYLVSSIAKYRCFAVSNGAVHNDSTDSVVGFKGQS